MNYFFYMTVKGKAQGAFESEGGHAGAGRELCLEFLQEISAPNDANREASSASSSLKPISVVKPWGESSAHFLTALWDNEVLPSVVLEFVRLNEKDKGEVNVETITLTNATVAFVKRSARRRPESPPETPFELEEIGFRYETMEVKNVLARKVARYDSKSGR
jgi:type VI secretion system Hcp family effector